MCEIKDILSEQQVEKYESAIRQLLDDGLKELFNLLGNGDKNAEFKKITIIAHELYRRNTQRFMQGTRLQDIAFLEQFIEKKTTDYTNFLERMKKIQVAGISAYLFSGQDYNLANELVQYEKKWLDSNPKYSWKDLVLLTSFYLNMNGFLPY